MADNKILGAVAVALGALGGGGYYVAQHPAPATEQYLTIPVALEVHDEMRDEFASNVGKVATQFLGEVQKLRIQNHRRELRQGRQNARYWEQVVGLDSLSHEERRLYEEQLDAIEYHRGQLLELGVQ
jgi:hypothetical protein